MNVHNAKPFMKETVVEQFGKRFLRSLQLTRWTQTRGSVVRKNWKKIKVMEFENELINFYRMFSRCLWNINKWKIKLKISSKTTKVFFAGKTCLYKSIGCAKPSTNVANRNPIRRKKLKPMRKTYWFNNDMPHTQWKFHGQLFCVFGTRNAVDVFPQPT